MEILLTPEQWVLDLYPEVDEMKTYKLSDYIIKSEVNDRVVILHTITWSIYDLSKEEYDDILNNEILIENKVVIPTELDEKSVADIVYVKRMTFKNLPTFDKIYSCVILTTTACNARCSYCYEQNLDKKETMTIATAEKIVQFLYERHKDIKQPLKVQWFGGEPLLNQRVIDYIIDRFIELELPYYSTMISNSFLFNEETVSKLDKWKLKNVQVTLDGINDDYNNAKNYVYTDVDAFLTIVNNIHNILEKSSTKVIIRLNVSNDNIFNIYDSVMYLKDEFKDYINTDRLNIYAAPLFDLRNDPSKAINGYWEEIERIKQVTNIPEISMCDIELNNETFKRKRINQNCMAFNGRSVVIMPNGNLTPCEHIKEEDIFGNIENVITNEEVIKKWYSFDGPQINYCKENNCPLQPICPRFYNCDEHLICSNEDVKNSRLNKAEEKLTRTYHFYYNNQNN